MKIAIQGHPTRGKEVIQILESLGGRNTFNYNGDYIRTAYFIGMDYSIYGFCTDSSKLGFKVYTLEEFEKEFPFKVGDKVTNGCEEYLITNMDLSARELNYKVRTSLGSVFWVRTRDLIEHQYKQVKEMKEERNITLTLDKAKEWYKKGGELKEIALQAFSEMELNPLPKSWEEFCEKYPVKNGECWVGSQDIIHSATFPQDRKYKTWIPSRRSAEAHLAMIQLEQLRNCWRQGWTPSKGDSGFGIRFDFYEGFKIIRLYSFSAFFSFPTEEIAKEFLKCFRDLIEKVGDLI